MSTNDKSDGHNTRQELAKEAVNHAREIEIEAEIKLGEFLGKMEKAPGGQPYQEFSTGQQGVPVEIPPTLADIGVSKNLSSEAEAQSGMYWLYEDIINQLNKLAEV